MSKPPPMGHNGGFAFDSRADIPKDVPRLYYFKCAIQDVLDDVLRMPKEERGVYLTALLVMYKEMEGLPADDKMAAMSLGLDVREWRHIKPKLIARGVLYERPSGRISNHRFEAEISAYVTEFRNRQEAAFERERKRREGVAQGGRSRRDRRDIAERSPGHRADVAEMSPTLAGGIGEDFSKKPNEINDGDTTRRPQANHNGAARARDLVIRNQESVSKTPPPHAAGAIVEGRDVEGSLPPGVAAAVRLVAILFGSETDPDYDRGYALATEYGSRYDPEDVVEGAEDYLAKRRDRVEFGVVTERRFAEYVRQAKANRKRREAGIQQVEKPEPKRLRPGPIGEGMTLADNGDIVLSNGVKAEWLELFGGNERLLALTLTGAGSRLRPNAPMDPEGQVRALLAAACKNIVTRRENAIASAEHAAKLRNAEAAGAEKTESRHDWIERIASEAEANMRGASK